MLWLASLSGAMAFGLCLCFVGISASLAATLTALTATATFGLVWHCRARARWHAALEAYAVREIAQKPSLAQIRRRWN